jgi:hypothetical protein
MSLRCLVVTERKKCSESKMKPTNTKWKLHWRKHVKESRKPTKRVLLSNKNKAVLDYASKYKMNTWVILIKKIVE